MNNKFRSFEDARTFARSLNLKSQKDWRNYCNKEKKPQDIPTDPGTTYKNKGWISYGDFLGTDRIATREIKFLSFNEARSFVRSLNLKNTKEFREYVKSDTSNKMIPTNPNVVYKDEWMGFGDFIRDVRIENVYPVEAGRASVFKYTTFLMDEQFIFGIPSKFIVYPIKKRVNNIIYRVYNKNKSLNRIEKRGLFKNNIGPFISFKY